MKEEALKLAEIFEEVGRAKYPYHLDAAEMLRRLVEELDKEKAKSGNLANSDFDTVYTKTALGESLTQTKPLSDEEIKAIANNLTCTPDKNWNVLFARAILKKASEK